MCGGGGGRGGWECGLREIPVNGGVPVLLEYWLCCDSLYTVTNTMMTSCRRLDYFVVSERLIKDVCDCVIRNEVYGSDHCPLVLSIADSAASDTPISNPTPKMETTPVTDPPTASAES